MKTVGEILKQARLKKAVTLDEVEKITKIRKKYLLALEENDFANLPPFTFSRGLLKNYSEYLGLPSHNLVAIFRRQTNQEGKQELLPKGIAKNPNEIPIKITPKLGAILGLILILGLFLFYLLFHLLSYIGKPYLRVSSPKNNLTVKSETIEVRGKTDPEGKLFINNQEVVIQKNGSFSERISLNKGKNKIIIIAKNKKGKENKKIVMINYK